MQINEDIHVHGLEELLLSKCPPQTIHRTRVTTIKLSIAYFTDIGKKVLNSLWNHKRPCLAKAILGKKQANVRRGQQRAIRAGESIEEEKEVDSVKVGSVTSRVVSNHIRAVTQVHL